MAKAVAKTGNSLPASMMQNMEDDAVEHGQKFDSDQLIIPRISILQDLSPQVKQSHSKFVEGARPGLFFNNVVNKMDQSILFTPAKFNVRYIAWRPRKDGGGLVDQNMSKEEVEENFDQTGIGSWVGQMAPRPGEDPVKVEVIQSPEWVGIATGETWGPMPVAISFPMTKSKAARDINTTINLTEEEGKNGPYTPPAFYHQFTLQSALESRGDDTWFGYVVIHDGYAEESVIARAKELKIAFDDGKAEVEADER